MTKWESVNKLVDYLRVNANVGPMKLSDIISSGQSLYKLSEINVCVVLGCLLDLDLIVLDCHDSIKSRSYLWIGGK